MSNTNIEIIKVTSSRQRKQFVKFPWKVYANDPYWIPPLVRTQLSRLNPGKNPFYKHGEVDFFLAIQNGEIVGTIAPWINHRINKYLNEKGAAFGFFELFNDQKVAASLLETACNWARQKGASYVRGPIYFSPQDSPGVLIKGFDSIPAPMVGHTPAYYAELIDGYGFRKHRDAFAYRIEIKAFNNDINKLPTKLLRVANSVEKRYRVKIRTLNLKNWESELQSAISIFNTALGYQREGVPMDDEEFIKMATNLRKIVDPKLIFFAEVDGRPIGLYVALPNINEALKHVNGVLFPFGWFYLVNYNRYVRVTSTKILGVLEDYRNKGIDALFYYKIAEELIKRGHEWIDYSLVAEENDMANKLIQRLGGKIYKICRTYHLDI